MGGIYNTVFTEQLAVKDEVAFMDAAKKKKIPQLLHKYSSVHNKIGRWIEDNRNKPDLTKLVSMLCTWRRHIGKETLQAHGLRHGLLGHPDRSPPRSDYQYDLATRLGG